ncbi:MAG: hypothetical protein GX154_09850 [Clostridiales bacterium]|nr:hypothetical protein [Clostridiales bacterium]
MLDKDMPYNDIPFITTIQIEETKGLQKLAEDTRVVIELLNYAISILPSPYILLDTLSLQGAKVSSGIENIVTSNYDLYAGYIFKN